ncbi:MAG: hypothetical protein H6739_18100 [Alphaproteobacteria bacterium]|nr:hypothetical protein [Alphaproteobacteria bacterium]
MRRALSLLSLCVILLAPTCEGVESLPALGEDIGQLERRLDRPAITTNLADAVYEVPLLDDFNPPDEDFINLRTMPRTETGGYLLEPGLYRFVAKSFCLKPGTYGPATATGDGHLLAPIKGPQAEVVTAIIRNWSAHPEFEHMEIQQLLWAIHIKAKIADLDTRKQLIAATLLTPEQLYQLNGGAIGLVPEPLMDQLIAKLPEPARSLAQTEDRMRRMLSKAETSYETIEEVAVLTGPVPEDGWLRRIPEGRWNLHPDGYFIRLMPDGYQRTTQEIYLPELTATFTFDALGRVTKVERPDGWVVESSYDDSVAPVEVSPGVKEYAFARIRFAEPDPDNPGQLREAVWENTGTVLVVDAPASQGRLAPAPHPRLPGLFGTRAADEWDEPDSDATNPEHYKDGLDVAINGSKREQAEWIGNHFLELLKEVLGWRRKLGAVERDGAGETSVGGNDVYNQRIGQSNEAYWDETADWDR